MAHPASGGNDANPGPERRILSSWKEIANYLGVSVRTAQSWERERELPVRRQGTSERARAVADTAALDAWRERNSGAPSPEPLPLPQAPPGAPRRRWWLGVGVAAAVVLGAVGLAALRAFPRTPARWRVDQEVLIVTDRQGRECWQYQFPHMLYRDQYDQAGESMGWAGDLDGDGSPDLVFGAHYEPVAQHGSEILCFSQRGEVKWRFRIGRKLVHAQREELSENFSLKRLAVFANRHGERRIVFVGNESKYYPAQVGVLTPAGRLAGEYFHSGALAGLGVLDMDGDGVPEILLAGTNNSGDGGATLLALDSEKVFGASAEDPLHTLHGLGPAQEKLRIRFPLSCLDRKFGYRPGINVLDVQPGEMGAIVEDWNGSGLFYHFTRGGRLKALVVGDIWRQKHATAFAEGKIDHQFNPAEEAALAQLTYLRGPM